MVKIARDAFLYLAPQSPVDAHAQCGSCLMYVPSIERCAIMGEARVTAGMSCGLYVHGVPHDQVVIRAVTPKEAGLVDRQVRCENCVAFSAGECDLYKKINRALPDMFDLDAKVDAKGCCNAQTPRPASRTDARVDQAASIMDGLLTRMAAVDAIADAITRHRVGTRALRQD